MADTLETQITDPQTPLETEIAALGPWFHNLHLPGGVQTAPQHALGDFPAFKWKEIAAHLPEDLTGWRALDIGCNAGFYSFELARRGAEVIGIDVESRYLAQARWAARQFGLEGRVTFEKRQVYDLARRAETFDLVLFLGVFYHLRYPLLALDLVAEKATRLVAFQTLTMPGDAVFGDTDGRGLHDREAMREEGWPKMAFIEGRFAGDPTNWWAPNHAGVEAMLRSSGLRVVARPGHEMYLCEPYESEARPIFAEQLRAATGRETGTGGTI